MRSWKLGNAFGIGVYVHWTFLLLPTLIFFDNLGRGGIDLAIFALGLVLAVFCCVVLHELGHALMARRFGIGTRDITLYPIGGVARLERMSEHPGEELFIALAGPAVNVAIAGVLWLLLQVLGAAVPGEMSLGTLLGGHFLWALLATNIVLVLFNMIPAFPMDGGRVLRALLVYRLGYLRATQMAAQLGTVLAGVFVLLGLFQPRIGPWQPNFMWVLVGMFVYFAAQQELWALRYRMFHRPTRPLDVRQAGDADFVVQTPVQPHFSGFTWDSRSRQWVQWQNGRAVHTIYVE